jgi:hypothetical protein
MSQADLCVYLNRTKWDPSSGIWFKYASGSSLSRCNTSSNAPSLNLDHFVVARTTFFNAPLSLKPTNIFFSDSEITRSDMSCKATIPAIFTPGLRLLSCQRRWRKKAQICRPASDESGDFRVKIRVLEAGSINEDDGTACIAGIRNWKEGGLVRARFQSTADLADSGPSCSVDKLLSSE